MTEQKLAESVQTTFWNSTLWVGLPRWYTCNDI